MARQLTPEALRFIQLHYSTPPETDAYETAETIIDTDRPFYAAPPVREAPAPQRRGLYLVPDLPAPAEVAAAVEPDPLEDWIQHPALPEAPAGRWARFVAAISALLRRG